MGGALFLSSNSSWSCPAHPHTCASEGAAPVSCPLLICLLRALSDFVSECDSLSFPVIPNLHPRPHLDFNDLLTFYLIASYLMGATCFSCAQAKVRNAMCLVSPWSACSLFGILLIWLPCHLRSLIDSRKIITLVHWPGFLLFFAAFCIPHGSRNEMFQNHHLTLVCLQSHLSRTLYELLNTFFCIYRMIFKAFPAMFKSCE